MTTNSDHEYVVIGAGAAGSIVAGQLAASGRRVLLLEGGSEVSTSDPDLWNPKNFFKVIENPALERGFKSTPQRNLENRALDLLQSEGTGGCQLHNAMVYVRGGRSTYDNWADTLGCSGWSYGELTPFFEFVEGVVGISSPEPTSFNQAFQAAAGRLGLTPNPNYNTAQSEYGCVPFQYTVDPTPVPRRTTAFEKFIQNRNLPTLMLQTGCRVRRLIIGEGLPAVEYDGPTGLVVVAPSQEIILCAGAISTPAILLRSGIGPAADLLALGIPVKQNCPAVGRNFHDDLGVGVLVAPGGDLPGEDYGYIGVGAFACSGNIDPVSQLARGPVNIEVQVSTSSLPGAPALPGLPSYVSIGASALHLKSRGTVKLNPADPWGKPIVDPNWLSDPADLDHAITALELCYALASDPGLAAEGGWTTPPVAPAAPVSRDVFETWVRTEGESVQHYVGSCAMGTDLSTSVVHPMNLRVHGVAGVRVMDASVAPTTVTGNTAGVSMVIGAKGAAMLLEQG